MPGSAPGQKVYSPRMRGCSLPARQRLLTVNVFPAYAGVFRTRWEKRARSPRIPRVCGGVPIRLIRDTQDLTYSPRMRGCS